VAKAAPDGYTVGMGAISTNALNPHIYKKMPFDPRKDFTAVGLLGNSTIVLEAGPALPVKSVAELIAHAKKSPGVPYATAGAGTSMHLTGVLFAQTSKTDLVHVPYKGSAPAVQDLIGGQTQLLIDAGPVLLPQVKGGKLKALAVTGPRRDPQLPDVPTVSELGLGGMESVGFQGLVGPAGLPKEVVDKLAAELAKVLAQAEVKAKFASTGSEVHSLGPTEFFSFVKGENDKWAKLIRERKLELD